MPEIEDFLPIFPEEDEQSVLTRMLTWLNDGVPQGSPEWIDPREGGLARTLLVPAAREMATLYDRVSVEFPAAANPLFAWGTYLDYWAEAVGTRRLVATYAGGTVTFEAPEDTVFPLGTEVGVDPDTTAAGAESPSYLTTAEVTILAGETTAEVLVVATEPGVVGNVAQGAVTFFLTAPPDAVATVVNEDAMFGGTDEETDEALRERVLGIYSSTPGGGNVSDYVQWVRSVAGVGGVSVIPEGEGPGTVVVMATDPEGNPVAPEVRLAIRDYLDPLTASTTASGAAPTTITVASTEGFRATGIVHMGQGTAERIHNYTNLDADGQHFVGVSPTPTFAAGDTVWQTGRGGGRAPVGHHVVVRSATGFNVTVAAVLRLDSGYAVADSPDSVNLVPALDAAVLAYINGLPPGQEIIYDRVVQAIMGVTGVYDITNLEVNGATVNVTPPPSGVPVIGAAGTDWLT